MMNVAFKLAGTTPGTAIVTWAEEAAWDGSYAETGTNDGRPVYVLDETHAIFWNTGFGRWVIGATIGDIFSEISHSSEDVEFPWLAVTWTKPVMDMTYPAVTEG